MISVISGAIEEYVSHHTSPEPKVLTQLVRETYANAAHPQMQVGHVEGAFLKFLVRVSRAKRVLEIGTYTGYSALAMAEALPIDGRIITCDIDPECTKIAKNSWSQSPHGAKITLKLGPALQTLESLQGSFDMVFVDADKENYIKYWEACLPKLFQGGLMVVDNVLWSGRVLKPKEATDRAIVAFNNHVMKDPRVELIMLTIRDGITLAWKF